MASEKKNVKQGPVYNKNQVKHATHHVSKLIKGLDNEANKIIKAQNDLADHINKVTQNFQEISRLVTGISNAALKTSASHSPQVKPVAKAPAKPVAKPAAKPVAKAPTKPAAKPVAKAPTKPAPKAPPKAETPKAVAKPTEKTSKASTADAKPRISLKDAIISILSASAEAIKPSEIASQIETKHGKWSKPALYAALKDPSIAKVGEGQSVKYTLTSRIAAEAPPKSEVVAEAQETESPVALASEPDTSDVESDDVIRKMLTKNTDVANVI
jgi:uncharacterized protein YoxC